MSLKSFDESLLTNLSSRHLFRGMLHGHEFILSRGIDHLARVMITYSMHHTYSIVHTHCQQIQWRKKSHLKKG